MDPQVMGAPSPDTIVKVLKAFVSGAKFTAQWTPTEFDDKVVAVLDKLVNEPWFASFVKFAIEQFEGGEQDLKVVFAKFVS